MAAGLDNILTTYDAVIVAAGFALLPPGSTVKDTTTQTKKWFKLSILDGPWVENSYGGGVTDFGIVSNLEIHWNPEMDTPIIRTTVANDIQFAVNAMIKVSNRPAEVTIVTAEKPASRLDRTLPDDWQWHGLFKILYRLTIDLS